VEDADDVDRFILVFEGLKQQALGLNESAELIPERAEGG